MDAADIRLDRCAGFSKLPSSDAMKGHAAVNATMFAKTACLLAISDCIDHRITQVESGFEGDSCVYEALMKTDVRESQPRSRRAHQAS
jgi:hypothetical protein